INVGPAEFHVAADGDGDIAADVVVDLVGPQQAVLGSGLLADFDITGKVKLLFAGVLSLLLVHAVEQVAGVAAGPEDELVGLHVDDTDALLVGGAHGEDDAAGNDNGLLAVGHGKTLGLKRGRRARGDAEDDVPGRRRWRRYTRGCGAAGRRR